MGVTSIQWTDRSCNPIRARHKVTGKVGWHCVMTSPGCARCYAQTLNGRFGTKLPFTQRSEEEVELFLDLKPMEALRRVRKPSRVFLCDMTDLFQDAVPNEWIDQLFEIMATMDQHTFQILTKRSSRLLEYSKTSRFAYQFPSNIWLGVSVENQKYADERIPDLLQVPAAVRFVSYEPALGPVDFGRVSCTKERDSEGASYYDALKGYSYWSHGCEFGISGPSLDWLIIGGESGPKARTFDLAWARWTIEQCRDTSCAVFVKQLGSRPFDSEGARDVPGATIKRSLEEARQPESLAVLAQCLEAMAIQLRDKKGGSMDEWPEDLRVRQFPSGSTQLQQHSNA